MTQKRKFRLGPLVLFVQVALLSVIGISVAVISYLTAKEQIQITIMENFERDKRVVINVLIDEIELISSAVELLSQGQDLQVLVKKQEWAQAEDGLYEALSKFSSTNIDILLIADPSGTLKGNAGNQIEQENELAVDYAPYIATKAWRVTGHTEKYILRSLPITDDEFGEVIGYLIYGVSLKDNFKLVQFLRQLTGTDGLALYAGGRFQAGTPLDKKQAMLNLGGELEGLQKDTVIPFGDDSFGYFTPFEMFQSGDLNIFFVQDTKAFSALNSAYQKDLLWLGLLIVISGFFVMFVFRYLVIKPAHQLADFARSAVGEREVLSYTPIFIKEFDSAAVVVHRVFEELQESKVHLEYLVHERTRELALEKERAENYLAIAGAIIVALDAEGTITLINNKGSEVLEYDIDTLIGKNWFDFVIPSDQKEMIKNVFAQAMQGNMELVEHFENEVVTRTGDRRMVSWHSTNVRDLNGDLVGVLSAGLDITEERKTQDALQEAFKFNEAILSNSPVGVIIFDADGGCLSANLAVADILGGTPEQLLKLNYHTIDSWKVNGIYDLAKEVVLNNSKIRQEVNTRTSFGKDVVIDCYLSPIKVSLKTHLLVMVTDVTETRNMQAQLIQSSKMATLGEMATGVAHELNQPLNVIRLAVGNIQRKSNKGDVDPDYLFGKLNKMVEQVERAAAIIDHMRIFGRKDTKEMSPLSPVKMVKESLSLIGEQLRLSNIEIITELEETGALILGHQVQIEQVLLNLLSNARDVLNAGNGAKNKIMLRVKKNENLGRVQIEVEDTGGGIAPEVLTRVFEPFFTTKEVGKGTGLGLSISYGIINDMGGTITAENTDEGALFIISIPVCGNDAVDGSLHADT